MTKSISARLNEAEDYEATTPLPLRSPTSAPEKFPIPALGSILAATVNAIADKVQCPEPIAAQSVMSAASLAVQAQANIVHPATGEERPISLAFVTVAASGERKSAADKIALEPIGLREAELYAKNETDQLSFENEKAAYERAKSAVLRQRKGPIPQQEVKKQLDALGHPPKPPLVPLLTAPDPTIEGLHKLMAVGEPSIGIFSDEGGSFVGGYGMADETRLRTGAGLSDLWDGKPVKRVRGGDGVTLLRGRRLTFHLMIQPGVADQLLADPLLQQQGLTSRLLVSSPPSIVGTRFQKPLKKSTEPALKRYVTRMLELLRLPQPRITPQGQELKPKPIQLSKEALQHWKKFADECELGMAPGGKLTAIQSFANKLPEHVLRIAAVMQIFESHRSKLVSASVIKRAIRIGRYYVSEALRLADDSSVSEQTKRAEYLLRWLQENHSDGLVHLAQIYQFGPRSVRNAEAARSTMRLLERYHWVKPIAGGAKIDGKRYQEVWEMVPTGQ